MPQNRYRSATLEKFQTVFPQSCDQMRIVDQVLNRIHSSGFGGGLTGTNLNIEGRQITVGEKIADGGYGVIYRAKDRSGQSYALKALQAPDEEHYRSILNEYEIHKLCSVHPNVVEVYGIASNPGTHQATILMEFCSENLIQQINNVFTQGFSEQTIVEVFSSVCEAVEFMHKLNPPVIHRDLKPENVLRNEGRWKLCDFGSGTRRIYNLENASERNEAMDDIQKNTTALYRSPEMCDLYRRQVIGPKADVWALGCILFKLCTFRDPFSEGTPLQILNLRYEWPTDRRINQKFKDLVSFMFVQDPNARPTARQVLGELQRSFPQLVSSKWALDGDAGESSPARQHRRHRESSSAEPQSSTQQALAQSSPPPAGSPQGESVQWSPFGNPPSTPGPFDSPSGPVRSPPAVDPFGPSSPPFVSPTSANPFGPSPPPFVAPTAANTFRPSPAFVSQPSPSPFGPGAANFAAPPTLDPFGPPVSVVTAPTADLLALGPESVAPPPAVVSSGQSPPVQVAHRIVALPAPKIDPGKIDQNPIAVMQELIALPGDVLASELSAINTALPDSYFLLQFLHNAGAKGCGILQVYPHITGVIGRVIESRKALAIEFPDYEGNFGLTDFLKRNRENPVPIGQPPISSEAAKKLQAHVDVAVALVRKAPNQVSAEEAFYAYQITAFVLAKLKQANIATSYIDNSAVPLFRNQHGSLKRAFSLASITLPFPAEPFNFNDPTFLKRIRPPTSRSLQV
jgi:AP2-associated kinase